MLKFKRQYSIALMVIGGIVLLVFGLNYLKGLDLLKKNNIYHAVYGDVSGINDATPVLYHGYKVGQVVGTDMLADGSGRIAVTMQINENRLKLTKDTHAELFSADLFSRAVRIRLGSGPEAVPGDTLLGGAELSLTESVGAQIDPLKRKAEGMLASVDSVLSAMQLILNENARGDIDASFTNLRATLENINSTTHNLDLLIAKESQHISGILTNVDKVMANLAANNEHLSNIFANMDSATAALANGRLERMMANLESTSTDLKAAMARINSGEGTLGKLMTDDSLYTNLNAATHQMDLLMEDLRLNPHRYLSIFGRKDRLPKLSKSDIERIRETYPPESKP
ncbi:MAG: MlaD family protein [Flavobacteriales bacterium]|nr:MCE family protein [Flavobacteriales bacterium]